MSTPPLTVDHFPYPTDHVVAVAAEPARVGQAVGRLRAAGVEEQRVALLAGEESARRIDPDGEGHGAGGSFVRTLQHLFGDVESEAAHEYAEALRRGAQVVAVHVTDREQAQVAGGVLSDVGFEHVRYFSPTFVEAL